jgi:glucosamine--fructose-6-phosphate aminotransferase (isomerizing)
MTESLGYFNSSLWDTLSGEYYRSFTEKKDYYHIFDYWRWDEKIVDDTLATYNWEKAIDTNTTWRIGDGTAAFYNYIYNTVAGFTEHDTFRSNQIREGQMTREEALRLVEYENRPRYQNIRWYLDTLDMNFDEVIKVINKIPKLYKES